jgi:hypothetical protein
MLIPTQVRPRPEGGGDFAPALGGGSGANRIARDPVGIISLNKAIENNTLQARASLHACRRAAP